jgi:hypothetical protein
MGRAYEDSLEEEVTGTAYVWIDEDQYYAKLESLESQGISEEKFNNEIVEKVSRAVNGDIDKSLYAYKYQEDYVILDGCADVSIDESGEVLIEYSGTEIADCKVDYEESEVSKRPDTGEMGKLVARVAEKVLTEMGFEVSHAVDEESIDWEEIMYDNLDDMLESLNTVDEDYYY